MLYNMILSYMKRDRREMETMIDPNSLSISKIDIVRGK